MEELTWDDIKAKPWYPLAKGICICCLILVALGLWNTAREVHTVNYSSKLADEFIYPEVDAMISTYADFDDLTYQKRIHVVSHPSSYSNRFNIDCEIYNLSSEKITQYYTQERDTNNVGHLRYSMQRFGEDMKSRYEKWRGPYLYNGYEIYFRPRIEHIYDDSAHYRIIGTDGNTYEYCDYGNHYCLDINDHTVSIERMTVYTPSYPENSPYTSAYKPHNYNPTNGVPYRGSYYDSAEDLYDDWYDDFDDYEEAEDYFDARS